MQNFESEYINFVQNPMKQSVLEKCHFAKDFSLDVVQKIQRFQRSHQNYEMTPLRQLGNLATYLQVEDILVKDESYRFGLKAFKVLGGMYAIGKYLAKKLNHNIENLSFAHLTSTETKRTIGELTFITATAGNHGRGIAWAARELGQTAVVYMPKNSSKLQIQAIEQEGARVEVINGTYDETVQLAAKTAQEKGWILLQDTSWENYEEIPYWIMQGYSTIGWEIVQQIKQSDIKRPTHIFLQAGVGSYAAGVAMFLTNYFQEKCPKIVLVEPRSANCFYESFRVGHENYQTVSGQLNSMMAGLNCGVPNPKAWEMLKEIADASLAISDQVSALGMRILGRPLAKDPSIIAGESGAATLGALYMLMEDQPYESVRENLDLHEKSTILIINTEGDTNPDRYRKIVWEGAYPLAD